MLNKHFHNYVPGRGNIRTGAIALVVMAMLLPACSSNDLDATGPGAGNVTTEEVADNTNALLGQTVTVRSEPVRKISPNTFTVSDEQFFGGETILVVNASGAPVVLADDDIEVQVTGKVAKFVAADIERDYDLDLEPDLYVEYEGKPAIVAQAIAPAPKPGEITDSPSQYYGRTIAVAGEVEDIVGPNAFTLDEEQLIGGNDLLVLVANPKTATTAIKDGAYVAVTGVLRPFVVADIERDYDLTWDLDLQRKLEVEYSKKPVLIVQGVYPSAVPPVAK